MRTAKIILKTFLVVAALGWGQTAWGNESKTVTYTITADGTTLTFTPKGYTFGSGVDPAAKTGSFDEAGFSIELYDGIIFTCKSGTFVQDGNNIYGSGAVTYEITSTGYFFSSEVRDYDGGTVAFITNRAQSSSSTISEGQRVGQIKLTLDDYWGTNDGKSEAKAFEISDATGLNLLSEHVSRGADFRDYYFKLNGNVTYSHTTDWNNVSSYEHNFEPIGNYAAGKCFAGTFDGQGNTISGIRIYENDAFDTDDNIGLFGYISGGTIKDVVLSDTRITARDNVGGIAGYMTGSSTVQNCNVSNTVAIHSAVTSNYHGGIVGNLFGGTVTNCTSAVTFTLAGSGSYYGGIAGYQQTAYPSSLTNCLALGVTIPSEAGFKGAIAGAHGSGTIENNYYSACSLVGLTPTVGTSSGDITDNDGAVPALRHNADNTRAISLLNDIHENYGNYNVSIADRTLYTDNYWNTLCLPFSLSGFTGTPLEGAVVKELDIEGDYTGHKTGVEGNTLHLYFKEATSITAGKPYFVKYSGGDNIVEPVFRGIRVCNTTPTGVTSEDTSVTFLGRYTSLSYAAADQRVLLMGEESKLYYPLSGASIGAFLAYFQLNNGITAGDLPSSIKSFVHNLDDEILDGIVLPPALHAQSSASAALWFTLDGRCLDTQPTQPGLYIVGGRKVVIK